MVGDSSLTYWVEQLSQTIQEQQEFIDSLSSSLAFELGKRSEVTSLLEFNSNPFLPWGGSMFAQFEAPSAGLVTFIGDAECFISNQETELDTTDLCSSAICLRSYTPEGSFTIPVSEGETLNITLNYPELARLFFSETKSTQQPNRTDTLSLDFSRSEVVFVDGSPVVLEVNYDIETPELWSLYGQMNGSWTTVQRVPTDSIVYVANTFENLDKLQPDFQDPMRIRLDSCESSELKLQFNRVFDWEPSIAFANSLIEIIVEPFEVDFRSTPRVVIESAEGVQLLLRTMYSYGIVYDGNNGNGWDEFGSYGLLGGEDSDRHAVIKLKDGSWVPN